METPKFTVIVTTYHLDNLIISLRSIDKLDHEFNLLIHNDNPKNIVTKELLQEYIPLKSPVIINQKVNQGLLKSRLECIKYLKDHQEFKTEYFIFVDDDDMLVDLDHTVTYKKVTTDVLIISYISDLLRCISNKVEFNRLRKYNREPCYGIRGNYFKTDNFIKFYEYLIGFLPTLYEVMGSDHINAGEDDILDGLYYLFEKHKNPLEKFTIRNNKITYLWNLIESPIDRYEFRDSRYSDNSEFSRDDLVSKINLVKDKFNEFLTHE